jgi:hypothetical protein
MEREEINEIVAFHPAGISTESLYRTRWLMAHNRLHDAAHKDIPVTQAFFEEYLAELRASEEIASRPA